MAIVVKQRQLDVLTFVESYRHEKAKSILELNASSDVHDKLPDTTIEFIRALESTVIVARKRPKSMPIPIIELSEGQDHSRVHVG